MRCRQAVGQGDQAERDHRRDQGRVLARHRAAGQQADQPPERPPREATVLPSPGDSPDQGGVIEAERPLDVGDDGQAVDPRRRQVDDGREPGRGLRAGSPRRRGDQHRRRGRIERHQELARPARPTTSRPSPPCPAGGASPRRTACSCRRCAAGTRSAPPGNTPSAPGGDTRGRRSRSPAASPPGA